MINIILDRASKGEFVLIAEIGVNYYDIAKRENISNMDAAKLMIDRAKDAGIHAVKFQSYKAGTIAAKESPSYWDTNMEPTTSQYQLFKKYDHFGYKEYKELSEYADSKGIEFLSTAFDYESADYLDELMNVYKISSSDLNNIPFVKYQARKGKPIILSTGASNEAEIDETMSAIRSVNDCPIILLHCVLEYPTPLEHANLNKIVSLKKKYPDIIVGYSDHTKIIPNYDIQKTAFNLGAVVIEKHYTLDKTIKGNDHLHSMDDVDAKNIIDSITEIVKYRGDYGLTCLESEKISRQNARRSIVANCDIMKGSIITSEMLTYKRPGTGINPAREQDIIGKKAACDIKDDTILQYEMFE